MSWFDSDRILVAASKHGSELAINCEQRELYFCFQSALSAVQWSNVLPSETPSDGTLFPTLYVGETSFGLYAMNSFVDQHTITYAPKYLGPPLLEGPSPIAISVQNFQ